MRGAERLYTLFFQSGSSNLEGLALDNVDRIVQQMAEPEFRDATVFLVGHADSAGTHQANLDVSDKRVRKVRDTLSARGVQVGLAIPLGDEFPIEPNDPKTGNPHNRRVEVWIKRK